MTEIQKILAEWARAKEENEACALATVVKVVGSAYRRPGARMLITNDGRTIGTISGGCLERDIAERAPSVLRASNATIVEYDTTSSEDIVWGLGLGCNGLVQVLLESITAESNAARLLEFADESLRERQTGVVVATLIHVNNHTRAKVGQRLMLREDGSVQDYVGESELAALILTDARAVFNKRRSKLRQYQLSEGEMEVFIEVVEPPVPLIVFGADMDAVPVAEFARHLGWQVTIIDPRARQATRDRFAFADNIVLCRAEEIARCVALENCAAAVVMSHNYPDDLTMLRALLSSPVGYVGVLGPKRRTEKMLQEIRADDDNFDDSRLEELHTPIGLDIGADTPEEIALSIVAEIKATLANRQGGLLKHRNAPIHDVMDGTNPATNLTNKSHTAATETEQILTSIRQ